jgi:hypothetical protein
LIPIQTRNLTDTHSDDAPSFSCSFQHPVRARAATVVAPGQWYFLESTEMSLIPSLYTGPSPRSSSPVHGPLYSAAHWGYAISPTRSTWLRASRSTAGRPYLTRVNGDGSCSPSPLSFMRRAGPSPYSHAFTLFLTVRFTEPGVGKCARQCYSVKRASAGI